MPGHDIIAIGASAGGVEAIVQVVRFLPADLPAAVFVVLHVPPQGTSLLPKILGRAGRLPACHAQDGQPIHTGRIYVAPPDRHLVVKNGQMRVVHGPRENRLRPSVDALFRTAARAYGPRVIGVVLSGVLDDGTAGLAVVKQLGGTAIVQDPAEALYAGMPANALDHVAVDYCLPLADIAPTLVRLTREPVDDAPAPGVPEHLSKEAEMTELDPTALNDAQRPGKPSVFGCPDCGGVLWELQDGDVLHFRCRVGHAYSPDTLLATQADRLEDALWTALRALEEQKVLTSRLERQAQERGFTRAVARFHQQAEDVEQRIAIIRRVLLETRPVPPPESETSSPELPVLQP